MRSRDRVGTSRIKKELARGSMVQVSHGLRQNQSEWSRRGLGPEKKPEAQEDRVETVTVTQWLGVCPPPH